MSEGNRIRSTTIVAVRRDGRVAVAGDGQVTMGQTVMKMTARKVRRLAGGRVVAGFAGASADAFTLFGRLEGKLEEHNGNLTRAAVELAKEWRMDRALRRLEAMLIAVDETVSLVISGTGDVIEPDGDVVAIGSGGPFAQAAAMALLEHTRLSAAEIARESMKVAESICVYTGGHVLLEELPRGGGEEA